MSVGGGATAIAMLRLGRGLELDAQILTGGGGDLFQHARRHEGGTAFHAADRLLLGADFFGEFGLAEPEALTQADDGGAGDCRVCNLSFDAYSCRLCMIWRSSLQVSLSVWWSA